MSKLAYDLVAFDVDGTLVDDTVFVWETLHDHFQTDRQSREQAFRSYMDGTWSYRRWFEHDIELLLGAGANHRRMMAALESMRLTTGALETIAALRRAGLCLVIISGSLNLVTEKFGLEALFDEVHLNRLWFDEQGELVRWQATPYDVFDKATGLREIAARRGIPLDRTAFIGDNFNDVAVARVAGFSAAINCKSDELAATVDVVLPESDLRSVLPYLLKSS